MKIYSDSKVSSFINGIKKEQSVEFLNWKNCSVEINPILEIEATVCIVQSL